MTRPTGTGSTPSRIGQVRPSHLVSTSGIGAVIDLPAMSAIVRGTDAWSGEQQVLISEPRLLAEVRRALGQPVRALRSAPIDPLGNDDPWSRVGVPVTPFPGWVRCTACFRLGPLHGSTQFELVHRWGRRTDLAKIVHATCPKQNHLTNAKKRRCVPARFLVACEAGHLDDFPYDTFVHRAKTTVCSGPRLSMRDGASSLQPEVWISCECKAGDNIARASGLAGASTLPRCRGRHPHLQTFESCGKELRLIVLGASNLWFGVTASALHLPDGGGLDEILADNWPLVGELPTAAVLQIVIESAPALRGLRDLPIGDVWAKVEIMKAAGGPSSEPEVDLLDAEWSLLCDPTTDLHDKDFKAIANTDVPEGFSSLLTQTVRVTRLREVQALIGFTRLDGPERRDLEPTNLVRLRNGPTEWVPAAEKRGEGVFFQFDEPRVRAWEASIRDHPRIEALRLSYRSWRRSMDREPDPLFPIARMLLVHTLSHLLIRQVSLECGYSSASIRERLYLGQPGARTAGFLLSTAASDSEGTLGGLVSLGETRYLTRLMNQAFADAARCSSDPLCAEHVPAPDSHSLHAAACHACLFASETSCEANNQWLDRAVLVDVSHDGLVFPR